MATEEYLEKLNKALPVGDCEEAPTMNELRAHGIRYLIRKKEPPAIADPSAPIINVIADSDYSSAFYILEMFQVENLSGSPWESNICIAYFNYMLNSIGFDIPKSEIHYIWRHQATEGKIHLGEANIDRAIYEISVQMNLTKMMEGLLCRVFENDFYAGEYDVLFDDPNDEESHYNVTVPTEVNEDLVWKQCEEEKSKLNRSDFDDQIQTKILLYLHEPGSHWSKPMEYQKIMSFASFVLASKYCYNIFCKTIHSIKGKIDIDEDPGYKAVRFHNFHDLFNGMTIQEIALEFDELVWHGGDCGCFFCPNSHIEICTSYFDKDELSVGGSESWCG